MMQRRRHRRRLPDRVARADGDAAAHEADAFYDLVVEVAIIRPGPIVGKMVHPVSEAARRAASRCTYAHPSLEPILKRTLGVPLFQEQLMRIAMVAAGFSGGQAEELRRAMGSKRSRGAHDALENELRAGMSANGIAGAAQDEIVAGIKSFALYGFPESHAASFALLVYASCYLKAHHPAAFYCALLNNWPMGFYHPATLITDARRHGVTRCPSTSRCSELAVRSGRRGGAGGQPIRLGLTYVPGCASRWGGALGAARRERPFASVADFGGARRRERRRRWRRWRRSARSRALGGTRRAALWQAAALGRSAALFAGVDAAPTGGRASPLPEMP